MSGPLFVALRRTRNGGGSGPLLSGMKMTPPWAPVDPSLAASLGDARLQLHHAAQFATAMGISYLPHAADDSHTTLEWLPAHGALALQAGPLPAATIRLAVRVMDLALLVLSGERVTASYTLTGKTIEQATAWLRQELAQAGVDANAYTLARHYDIPAHPVGSGEPFSADAARLEQLARWIGNASSALEATREASNGAAVRCWPHHFDIATLVTVRPGVTVGVGLEPGDGYYDEPYFYVNAHPEPSVDALTDSLEGGGQWHTREWIGAVLPGSHLSEDAAKQEPKVRAFLDSAVRACRQLVS